MKRREARGQITQFFRDRGFGFIRTIEGEQVFFNFQSFFDHGTFGTLRGDEEVTLRIGEDRNGRGTRAWSVEVIG